MTPPSATHLLETVRHPLLSVTLIGSLPQQLRATNLWLAKTNMKLVSKPVSRQIKLVAGKFVDSFWSGRMTVVSRISFVAEGSQRGERRHVSDLAVMLGLPRDAPAAPAERMEQ
ncbi:hypothetical protein MPLB_2300020 [Mesorhizobium sp. ORS 3324]|nr:hypothetical protein MPLB_2300020 [Mesorhizobium sp. ORS 3324]